MVADKVRYLISTMNSYRQYVTKLAFHDDVGYYVYKYTKILEFSTRLLEWGSEGIITLKDCKDVCTNKLLVSQT